MNDAELVVGDVGSNPVAAYWTPTGGRVVLGQVGTASYDCCSSFGDVNEAGDAVGTSTLGADLALTLWSQGTGAYIDLPTGRGRNFAHGINEAGEITAVDDQAGGRPYYRPAGGGAITMLSFAPSYFSGFSTDINDSRIITGYLNLSGVGPRHAMAWPGPAAAPVDLGTLGGSNSEAHAINAAGDIVGWSETVPGDQSRHATLWPASGGIVDLRTWPNACPGASDAADVSDAGVIVGRCNGRPVIWTAVEGMRYLPMPASGTIGEPKSINNKHVIVGMTGNFGGSIWRPLNAQPLADAGGPYVGTEGTSVALSAAASSDPDGDVLSYEWDFGDGSTGSGIDPTHTYVENGTYTVSLTVTDVHGVASAPVTTSAIIANVGPSIESLIGPGDPIALVNGAAEASFTASFTDLGTLDTHSGTLSCDGGTAGTASVSETGGTGTATAACFFQSAGVYSVAMKIADDDGGEDTEVASQYVVVFDPSGGFVTGGGWIHSPAGAYSADPVLAGKATFGFVSKYHKGAAIPDGNTEFHFHAGAFSFSSTSYEWLVIAGARAQYKGDGKVGGQAGYRFLLTATDGQLPGGEDSDRFRIKIWNKESGAVVYDNVLDAPDDIDSASPALLGGGSISIKR